MPKEIRPGRPTTRRYSDEEKAQAVRLVRQLRRELGTEHGTVQRVADQLGYGVETVRKWVKGADVDEGVKPGQSSERGEAEGARAGEPGAQAGERDFASGVGLFRPGGARPPMEVIVGFVDDNRDELGVEPICRALQIAPSSYYAAKKRELEPSARTVRDAALKQVLMVLWVANRKVYGAHKLWQAALRAGHDIGGTRPPG